MPVFDISTYKSRLADARLKKKLSQQDVANMLKIQRTTYSTWEQTKKTSFPNLEIFFHLCQLLDVSADYLLGLSDKPQLHTPDNDPNPLSARYKDNRPSVKLYRSLFDSLDDAHQSEAIKHLEYLNYQQQIDNPTDSKIEA